MTRPQRKATKGKKRKEIKNPAKQRTRIGSRSVRWAKRVLGKEIGNRVAVVEKELGKKFLSIEKLPKGGIYITMGTKKIGFNIAIIGEEIIVVEWLLGKTLIPKQVNYPFNPKERESRIHALRVAFNLALSKIEDSLKD